MSSCETASSSLSWLDGLGEELGDPSLVVREQVAKALRLAVESLSAVHIGVVVHLQERLERDAEALRVMEHAAMMIGNAPGARIEIEPALELA